MRQQVINDFKARFRRKPVHTGDVGEIVEGTIRVVAQQSASIADGRSLHVDAHLVAIELGALDRGRIPGQQFGDGRVVLQLLQIGDGGGQRHQTSPRPGRRLAPVQRALLPDVEEAHQHDADVNQHLPETKHLKIAQNHRPGIKKDGFNVEQDEQHAHQIEFDRKTFSGVADGGHATLIGRHLGPGWAAIPDQPGKQDDRARKGSRDQEVNQ